MSTRGFSLPGMLHLALTMKWINASSSDVPAVKATGSRKRSPSPGRKAAAEGMPKHIMKAVELVMDWNKMELVERLGVETVITQQKYTRNKRAMSIS